MFLEILFTFLLTILFTIFLINHAKKIKLIDTPNERSSHNTPKPRGAGIAIFFSILISIILFHKNFFIEHYLFFISISIVFFAGLIDDIKGISAKTKFFAISIAITILFLSNKFQIISLGTWFGYELILPIIISYLFTLFAINGYTNALNLIDGLDGLAGGISIIIFASFLFLGFQYEDNFIITISSLYLTALFAFILFNWYPSKIFLGDSGSLLIGFTISLLSIKLLDYINPVSILFLASLPILDTIIVMVRRLQRHLSPFSADRSHIHHKILRWKTKVDFSVMLLLLIQLSFSLLGIITIKGSNFINLLIYLLLLKISFYVFDERRTPRKESIIPNKIKLTDVVLRNKYIYHILFIILLSILIILKSRQA